MKRQSPPRSYKAVINSLAQVWRIDPVSPQEAIWQLGTPTLHALPQSGIRVAIWNMCKGAGGLLFEHDYRMLCYRSDVILTQEALLSQRSIRVFCEPGFRVVHAASYMRRDRLRDGVMTVSRVAPDPQRLHRVICKYPEPILKTPKVALVSFFPLMDSQESLMIVNLHATLIRLKSAAVEEMEHLIAHLPDHRGPILLAGDFNTFSPGYLKAVHSILKKLSLEHMPIREDPRPKSQALDQVFSRGLDIHSIQVDTTIKNSDHFPLILTMSCKKS